MLEERGSDAIGGRAVTVMFAAAQVDSVDGDRVLGPRPTLCEVCCLHRGEPTTRTGRRSRGRAVPGALHGGRASGEIGRALAAMRLDPGVQAIDRTHRPGQTRPVLVYWLIAQGTVEDKILELRAGKCALAAGIFTDDGGGLAGLSAADLELLFS